MDEVTMLDVLISQAHRRIEVSRGELVDAQEKTGDFPSYDSQVSISLALDRLNSNVKRLRELMDKKFPETVGVWKS